jgi:hypothetical protein
MAVTYPGKGRNDPGSAPTSAPSPAGLEWTPAGGGQFVGGVAANAPNNPYTPSYTSGLNTGGGDTGGGGGGGDGGGAAFDPMAAYYAEQERRRTINAIAAMRGLMEQYGLSSLMGKIEQYVKEGYEADAIMALIRTTPEYETRFPAMKMLMQKQRAISEAEYIAYERRAAELERAYGMPSGMLDKTAVTKLIGNEVSAQELEQRLTLAASGAYQTLPAVREQFKSYYGIDSGGLTAYFLDPDKALPLLNKQFVSAQIGAEAAMQGVGVGIQTAEMLQAAGITQEQARQGFEGVSAQRGLTTGRGDVVTQNQLIEGNLLQSAQAQQEIERTASSRRGRFQAGGTVVSNEQGLLGLGSAAT